jgi:hypothetical protein
MEIRSHFDLIFILFFICFFEGFHLVDQKPSG